MPQRREDAVEKEAGQDSFDQLDFVYAPLPHNENLSLDSIEEYSQKKDAKIRQELEKASSDPDRAVSFLAKYDEEIVLELQAGIESGEISKQRIKRYYSLARLRFLGVPNPSEFLSACFDQPTSMLFEYEERHSREGVKGYDFSRAVELAKNLLEIVDNPAEFLRRTSAIGLVFTMMTHENQSSSEFKSLVDRLMQIPEEQFAPASESMLQLTWLGRTYGFEDHMREEFASRLDYLENYPNFDVDDQAALQAQSILQTLCGSPAERMSRVLGNNDEIQALLVIAQELFIKHQRERESVDRFQDRERLKKIWYRKPILFGLARSIQEGRRIDLSSEDYRSLDHSYMDDGQADRIERQVAISLNDEQRHVAEMLDLHAVDTTELVVQIDSLVQRTLNLQLPFDTREAILTLVNGGGQDQDAFSSKAFYRISEIFQNVDDGNILQEWIQVERELERTSRMRHSGDERNFMDAIDRRHALKRLLSRTMLVGESGAIDSELLRHVLRQAKEVPVSRYLDAETISQLPEKDRKLVRLVLQIDVASATNTLDFLIDNADQIVQHVGEDFKVTPEFVLLFFQSSYAAGSNSHNEIARILERSGLATGLVDYLNRIHPSLRLTGTPLSDHYEPIFLIFSGNADETERNRKLLEYWKERHAGVFIRSFSKDLLAEYFGEPIAQAFLAALPKQTDERRNAFLHNDYDRTSQWIIDMQKQTSENRWGSPALEGVTFDFSQDIKIATAFITKFGLAKNPFLFEIFKVLTLVEADAEYVLPQRVQELGLTRLEDLYREYDQIHSYLISTEPLIKVGQLSEFQKVLLSSVTGRDTHTFTRGDTMQDILDRYQRDIDSGEVLPVSPEYVVERVSFSDVEIEYEPSEAVQSKFNLILEIVGEIIEHPGEEHWKRVVQDFKVLLAEQVQTLQAKFKSVPEKQQPFIQKQLEQLSATVERVSEISSIDEALQVIGAYDPDKQQSDAWEILVQRIVFSRILKDGPIQDKLQSLAAASELSPKALLTAINVYDELIKHHAINFGSDESSPYWSSQTREFFADKGRKKQLKRLKGSFASVVGALKEDISRFERTVLETQRGIDMIPDRGLIGEMSGYIANACYTNEQSMLRNWEVTPYKFIDTTKDPAELVGTGLVFQVELENGEPALLVRAINIPNEDAYDMETFCEEFIDAIARVGQKTGAKKILVPGATGAMSNYQMTIGHLKSKYCEGQWPVSLSSYFAFNGYDLTSNVYVAREL